MTRIGAILLAAGGSRRLGSPKQLISRNGKPLVRIALDRLSAANPEFVLVVLGAESQRVRSALSDSRAEVITNQHWEQGIGSSISHGVRHVLHRHVDGLLIALCDQPAIPGDHFHSLSEQFALRQADIVATKYADTVGVPAVFGKAVFDSLAALDGDRGAKSLLRDARWKVECIRCDAAAIDLDTPEDARRFAVEE